MINLSNYEDFFLLYIDNELNEKQCAAVETFVLRHPHLATELDMLQEAKLPAEEAFSCSNKSVLYKANGSNININNYEEYFLLHTDKELSPAQEAEVEQFVLQHPQLQEAFLLLQQAKLVTETVECPNKQLLYRQPAKRVVPLYIARMAVAASVLGAVLLIGQVWVNYTDKPTQQVATNQHQPTPVEQQTPSPSSTEVALPTIKGSDRIVAKTDAQKTGKVPVKTTKGVDKIPVVDKYKTNDTKQELISIPSLPVIAQSVPVQDREMINMDAAKYDRPATLKPLEEVSDTETEALVIYASNQYRMAQPAVYVEINTDEDDQTLYVGSLQLNKAKVNGLFKKATHLLGNKSKN